jgi:actin-like ATPase involved in cell morphogenesis
MIVSVLTGDIVNSSKIPAAGVSLMKSLNKFLNQQKKNYPDIKFEIYRGDAFQIVLFQPELAIKLATLIRTFVISSSPTPTQRYDVRISIGLGTADKLDSKVTLSNGQAFIFSGHGLDKIKIKERLVFKSGDEQLNSDMFISTTALSVIISQWTLKRAKIALAMMLGESREDICKKFKILTTTLSTSLSGSNYSEMQKIIEWSEDRIKIYTDEQKI